MTSKKRLDQYVIEQKPLISRAYGAKLIDQGRVLVNGQPSRPGYKLHATDMVTIDYNEDEIGKVDDIDLPVIYEDNDCLVIDKPAGILTHALGKHGNEASVASFLRVKLSKDSPWNGVKDSTIGDRAGIVHRLDRATSGVIIGAKNQEALSWLQKQFADRRVKKTYVAVVEGQLKQDEAVIDMPIERNPKAPATFRVGPNGKPAVTHYTVLKQNGRYSLLELRPETGRTHQLRVHLQKIGHPIIGDPLYGDGTFGDRLFLHAQSLEITLPNRERTIFSAPLPPEFEEKVP